MWQFQNNISRSHTKAGLSDSHLLSQLLGRLRQEDGEFEASLGNTARCYLKNKNITHTHTSQEPRCMKHGVEK
jgi:hypothetical protein